ncbi:MAG: recombinase family protein, partial [Candidatus Marinimicrobia bacterium]|nr:recombinase family protein [Candidatus Neomarinimicrobiota bacterium]MBT6929482.1 recombinase family protein [Candidatus Neomarinimicrobiota bacterium]
MTKYFLYARKSTDVEDKQVSSIDDQLAVLRTLAKDEKIIISQEFIERQSAKKPGRPIFDEMLSLIEKGEADGIVCWKLDRLARNPVDSGRVSWLLQEGVIQHIQTHDRSFYPTDNVLMTSVEFGMANQFILDLKINTKRGLQAKAKRGDYPGLAPIGYLNDSRIKLVVVDKKKSKIVKQAFELYAEGNSHLGDIADFFFKNKIKTKGGKLIPRDQISYLLFNPFYIGLFRYSGELYEGNHKPIISKELFDKVQAVLKKKCRPKSVGSEPQALCGLVRCGSCEMMITAEHKFKHQKNGNIHDYVYYRCTRKNKKIKCTEPAVREELLDSQLTELLKKYTMPKEWIEELSKKADKDEQEAVYSTGKRAQELRNEIQNVSQKLQRLLDAYLDQDIEQETYRSEKAELLSRKKSLEEKIGNLEQGAIAWVEPLRNWIKDAQILGEMGEKASLPLKKQNLQKIFGLNPFGIKTGLTLSARKARGVAKKQWAFVTDARQKIGKMETCLIVEHRFIIGLFLYAKMWQNPEVQEALLSTKGTFIYHNVGLEHPNTSLPE